MFKLNPFNGWLLARREDTLIEDYVLFCFFSINLFMRVYGPFPDFCDYNFNCGKSRVDGFYLLLSGLYSFLRFISVSVVQEHFTSSFDGSAIRVTDDPIVDGQVRNRSKVQSCGNMRSLHIVPDTARALRRRISSALGPLSEVELWLDTGYRTTAIQSCQLVFCPDDFDIVS